MERTSLFENNKKYHQVFYPREGEYARAHSEKPKQAEYARLQSVKPNQTGPYAKLKINPKNKKII